MKEGSDKALLIDSGFGMLDLNSIIRKLTDKPVICACTHGHLDHAMGAAQFEKAYMHSAETDVYKKHSDPAMMRKAAENGLLIPRSATGGCCSHTEDSWYTAKKNSEQDGYGPSYAGTNPVSHLVFFYLVYTGIIKKKGRSELCIMYGAILGDMIGAPYEFDRGIRQINFRFLAENRSLQMTPL